MPNIHELVDSVASQLSGEPDVEVWFKSLEIKNASSQLSLAGFMGKQCNFSIVGGSLAGTYQLLTGFYVLGDMPYEF